MADGAAMRLDRWLWWSRISASRAFAQALAEGGRLRLNGRRIERAHVAVRVGDVLAFVAYGGKVRVMRVEALPARRGPPAEGRACYQELTTGENVSQEAPSD
jgi:ribosome-associated heat shock protein Hsp15